MNIKYYHIVYALIYVFYYGNDIVCVCVLLSNAKLLDRKTKITHKVGRHTQE